MSGLAAVAAGIATYLLVRGQVPEAIAERIGKQLRPPTIAHPSAPREGRLEIAGLRWTPWQRRFYRFVAAGAGAFIGLLLAQGDLLLSGRGRSPAGLAAAGVLSGLLAQRVWITQRGERRTLTLRQELPVLADMLALAVVAGESVASGLERLRAETRGEAGAELGRILDEYNHGQSLTDALIEAGERTSVDDARRVYDLLASAHHSGGRLAEDLMDLSADLRAGLARDLTEEGGKRALAIYGPILLLMVPVTLMFLVFPTIAGLDLLANTP